jgi:hypothetical protein
MVLGSFPSLGKLKTKVHEVIHEFCRLGANVIKFFPVIDASDK